VNKWKKDIIFISTLKLINIKDNCLKVDKAMIFLKSISNKPFIPA
jgi:hypothetical protein